MIDTIIFDMDGTLLNTLEDLTDSVNFALGKFSMKLRTIEEIRSFIGNGVNMLVKRSVPAGTDSETTEKVFACFREHYLKNMRNKTAPYEGVREMLESLKKSGYKTGVVSNKLDSAVKELCDELFPSLITSAQGAKGESDRKPNPENVFRCMEETGSKKENCLYVGDSEVDVQTAQNAGIKCLCVLWGYRDKEFLSSFGADSFIEKPSEIFEVLSKWE